VNTAQSPDNAGAIRRHLVFGWVGLAVFAVLGLGLDAMHGFKVGWYLNVGNETRRLLFTLAHAHGVLLSLVNLAFAFTLSMSSGSPSSLRKASPMLLSAQIAMPLGFLLGGLVTYDGDPGLGIFLLHVGGVLLLGGLGFVAWGVLRGE